MAIRGIEANLGGISEGYLRHRLAGVSASTSSWPLQPVQLGQKNLVDDPRSLLTRFGNQLIGVLPHNLITKNAIHENVDSVLSCLKSNV